MSKSGLGTGSYENDKETKLVNALDNNHSRLFNIFTVGINSHVERNVLHLLLSIVTIF